jgi:hypothetical protein
MPSVTKAQQVDWNPHFSKSGAAVKMAAPTQYQVETGQAVHAGEMRAAQAEGGKKGAMAGLGIGGGIAGAAVPAAVAAGPLGWGILAAGLAGSALLGWGIGRGAAKKPERARQKADAKRADIAALGGQAQGAQQAKLAKEQRASQTRAGKAPSAARTFTDDEQLIQATSLSGANPSHDAWHASVFGSGRSV